MAEGHRRFLVLAQKGGDDSENKWLSAVGEGAQFSSGAVAIYWLSTRTLRTYQGLEDLTHMIGGAATTISWIDEDLSSVVSGSRFVEDQA